MERLFMIVPRRLRLRRRKRRLVRIADDSILFEEGSIGEGAIHNQAWNANGRRNRIRRTRRLRLRRLLWKLEMEASESCKHPFLSNTNVLPIFCKKCQYPKPSKPSHCSAVVRSGIIQPDPANIKIWDRQRQPSGSHCIVINEFAKGPSTNEAVGWGVTLLGIAATAFVAWR